jgi:hypothetical protein
MKIFTMIRRAFSRPADFLDSAREVEGCVGSALLRRMGETSPTGDVIASGRARPTSSRMAIA